jgi:hypothetical protein
MFSYLSIGLAAEATLNNINKNTSRQSLNESFYCKITDFHKGTRSSRPHFWFLFHNKLEVIYSDYNSLKYYLENPSENYNVVLKAQKGVWNYYVVKDWRIEAAD